eukprot:gene8523-11556_t
MIIAVGMRFWGQADLFEAPATPGNPTGAITAGLILQGSILTFFSFLGFEDMINVAEEVERPERTIPLALIAAMIVASLIYVAVSITAVSVVPWRELAAAPGPLNLVIDRAAPWFPAFGFTVITIAAVANTALVNYVMASRLLYGMSRQGLLPASLGKVHHRRQTPYVAIGILLVALVVFTVVNGALIVLQRREGKIEGAFNCPVVIPALGVAICLLMIGGRLSDDRRRDDYRHPDLVWTDAAVAIAIAAGPGAGRVLVVGYDPEHTTRVGRGENAGRTLTEANIVRGLTDAGAWDGTPTDLVVAA